MSALLTEPTEERTARAPRGFRRASAPRRSGLPPPIFYKSWESLRIALGSLRSNKLRTALTLVGVVVGVAAVIAVVTIIKGLDQTVASTFSSQGSTVFTVSKRPQVITSREDFIKFNRRKDVTEDDAEAVARLCPACWRTGVAANSQATVKAGDQSSDGVRVRGLTLSMFAIEDTDIVAGRAWTDVEEAAGRDVAVVGPDILDNLFQGAPPEQVIGKFVRVEGRSYQIVGVVVGVAAVIAVVTIIKGLDQTVASTFSSQGSTVFTISKRPQVITSREDFIKFNRRKDVTEDDAEAITRLCNACWRTGVSANAQATVKAGDQSSDGVRVRGLTLSMYAIEDTDVVAGRAWTDV